MAMSTAATDGATNTVSRTRATLRVRRVSARVSISTHVQLPPNPSQSPQLHTSDYVDFDDEDLFNSILDRIASHHQTINHRSSPTAKSFIDSLPVLKFSSLSPANSCPRSCSICRDDLQFYTEVTQLPCKHVYHRDCIVPWLGRSNSCPLCRFQLPAEAEANQKQVRRFTVTMGDLNMDGWGEDQEAAFRDAMRRNGWVQATIRVAQPASSSRSGSEAAGGSEDSVSSPLEQRDNMVDEDGDTLMLDA